MLEVLHSEGDQAGAIACLDLMGGAGVRKYRRICRVGVKLTSRAGVTMYKRLQNKNDKV